MLFYHGTNEAQWKSTQAQGFLLNPRGPYTPVTYLAVERQEAECYGPVVLGVDYEPGKGRDNYREGCWQLRVYSKIPLTSVWRLS